eukprot:7383601-Prymnesium_polylepis.2
MAACRCRFDDTVEGDGGGAVLAALVNQQKGTVEAQREADFLCQRVATLARPCLGREVEAEALRDRGTARLGGDLDRRHPRELLEHMQRARIVIAAVDTRWLCPHFSWLGVPIWVLLRVLLLHPTTPFELTFRDASRQYARGVQPWHRSAACTVQQHTTLHGRRADSRSGLGPDV